MDRHGIAIVLDEIATLLEIQGENRFKVRAFATAARVVEQSGEQFSELVNQNRLEDLQGIGPATAAVIRELAEQGTSRYYEQLRERTPSGLLQLLAVPRLGASRVRLLHEKLGIASLDELEEAAREGRVAAVPGFGARTQARILEGIAQVRGSAGRRRYAESTELAHRLRAFVAAQPGITRADIAGELRRACETVGSIIVLAETRDGSASDVLLPLRDLPGVVPAAGEEDSITGQLADRVELRVATAHAEQYAARLLFETGSAEHVTRLELLARERGFELTKRGLFREGERLPTSEESAIYNALGLQWIPPELRETGEEVVVSAEGILPDLVTYEQLRGCFHCHTRWSDGRATVEEMAEAARARGWRYLGIADHSRFAGYAGGMTPDEIIAQHAEIDEWNAMHGKKLWLFKGIEADILPGGQLDYEDEPDILARFDYVIASAHSAFTLDSAEQTRRFLRVIENPFVTFLGHLTGRLLLSRRGCAMDLGSVFDAVARRGIGIEINSDPWRMELDWRHWPAARARGIPAAINPDAHSIAQLDYVHNGVAVARKGWLQADSIVNCWPLSRVVQFFTRTRRKAVP